MADYSDEINNILSPSPQKETKPKQDYSDVISDVIGNPRSQVSSNLYSTISIPPETATKQWQLANQTKIPIEVIRTHENDVRQMTEFDSFNIDDLANNFPKVAAQLTDYTKAPAIRDDIDSLTYFEKIIGNTRKEFQSNEAGAQSTNLRLKAMAFEATGNDKFKLSPLEENELRLYEQEQKQRNVDYQLGLFKSDTAELLAKVPAYTIGQIPNIVQIAKTAIPASIGGFFVSGLNPAGAATGGALGAFSASSRRMTADAYDEYKNYVDEAGKPIEKQVAAGAALLTGGIGGAIELFPGAVLTAPIRKLFTKETAKELLKTSAGRETLKNIAGGMIAEGGAEAAQEYTNVIVGEGAKYVSEGKFKSFGVDKEKVDADTVLKFLGSKEVKERIKENAIAGVIGGGSFGAASSAVTYASSIAQKRTQDAEDKGLINQIYNRIKQSKIFKRDPELLKEVTNDTLGEQNAYFNPEEVQTFFQTKSPEELEQFNKILPEMQEQLDSALETGSKIVLPSNKALIAFAQNEKFSDLKNIMSFSPETLNEQEAQDTFLNSVKSNVDFEESKKQISIEEKAVKENIKKQIQSLGLSQNDTRDIESAITAYYDTKSSRYGSEEAKQVLNTYLKNLQIKSGVKNLKSIDDLDSFINQARKFKEPKKSKPLLKFLKEKGGVKLGSNLAGELKNMGLTPKTAPGLFKKEDGIGDVDNIPLSEFQERFPNVQTNFGEDYVDRQAVLDLIGKEIAGEDISQTKTEEQEKMARFLEDLDRIGIELGGASNEDVKKAIDSFKDEQPTNDDNKSKLSVEELEKPQPEFNPETKPELIEPEKPIEDFGEKIVGAKKDLFKTYHKSINEKLPEDYKDITLTKYFPEPNYEAMIADGVDVKVLAAVKAIRDLIPNKPRTPFKLKRWVDNFKAARSLADDLINGNLNVDKFIAESKGLSGGNKFHEAIKLYAELGYPAFLNAKDWTIGRSLVSLYRGVKYEPYKSLFMVAKGRQDFGQAFETYNEAVDALRNKLSVKPAPETRVTKLDIYQNTRTREIFIGKKVAAGKFIDLRKGFASMKEARTFLKENEQSLLELLAKRKETPPTRKAANEERVGKDYRMGENTTPEKFASEFGFRGIQFGNYVEQAKRANDLNNSYDALLDLSNILNVPSRALSLNGELGIAFGARGTGGKDAASAHYEPNNVVINLTKNKGAGSLGHEWWHALDNFFGKQVGKDFLTKNKETNNANLPIRKEVIDAYKDLMKAIAASELPNRSRKLDATKTKDYWSTLEEMSARSFETYLISKAKKEGYSNDYLANVLDEKVSDVSNEMNKDLGLEQKPYAYPTEKEAPQINAAFDHLFNTLKTKETEKGITFYQNKSNPQGATQFLGQKPIISLFKSANRSTLLHELGHVFLQIERDISRLPNISEQVKNDWKTLEDWLEIKDGKITIEAHEKFARGFEAYLREGKAPSAGLRNAFRRFKRWLVRIYKDVKKLDVTLTKPVREVFDRMLATDEQIEELRNNPIYRAEEKVLELLNDKQKADYLELSKSADERAKEKLLARKLRDLRREKTKTFKEEKAAAKARIEKELAAQPVYKAFDYLRSPEGTKLNIAEVESYDGDFVKRLPKDILSEEGSPVDMVADFLGYSDGGQMLNDLANAPKFNTEVNRLTNEEMAAKNPVNEEQETVDASQNDTRANKILYELNAVNRKVHTLVDNKEAYKQKAKDIIAKKQIKDATQNNLFYLNEVKAAREAGKAIGAGNFELAVEWKKKQLLNHYLFRESLKLKKDVNDALKRYSRYKRKPVVGKVFIEEEYREKIVNLLADFGLAEKEIDHQKTNIAELEQWKKEQTEEGVLGLVPFPEIAEFQNKDNYRNLTSDQFRTLDDAVTNLAHIAYGLRELEINDKRVALDDIAQQIKETVEENLKKRPEIRGNLTPKQKINAAFESFIMPLIKVKNIALKLDGEKPLGTFYNYFVKPVAEGEIKRNAAMEELYKKLDGLYAKYFGTKAGEISGKKIFIPEANFSYSKQDMIAFALNWGNSTNRRRVKDGFGYGDAQINAILSNLTKKDWEFVQEMWDLIGSFYGDIANLQKKLVGFKPGKVRPLPFVIKTTDGQNIKLRGGYYPIAYDGQLTKDTSESNLNAIFGSTLDYIKWEKSYTKGRSAERVQKKIDLSLKPAFRHLANVLNDLSLKEQSWNSYKILNNNKVKNAIESHAGRETNKQLDTWLKDIFGGSMLSYDAFSGLINNLRAGTTISTMGLKVATTIMQVSGFTQSIVKIGFKDMLIGVFSSLGNGNPMQINKNVSLAFEKSKVLKERSKTFHRDIYDTLRKMERKGGIAEKATGIYFWPMAKMQTMVDIPTWLGAYNKGLREFKGDENKAVDYADLMLVQSQASGLEQDLSAFERGSVGGTRKSSLVKIFTAFYSYFNAKLNLAAESYRNTDFKKPRDIARFASDFLLLFWLEALIGELLRGRTPDDADDEGKFLAYNMKLTLATFLSQFPIAREAVSAAQGFDATPSGLSGIEKVTKGGVSVVKELSSDEEVDISKVIEGLNDASGIIFKYPSGQIDVAIDAFQKSNEGENVAPIDYFIKPAK